MSLKTGANNTDQKKIREGYLNGWTTEALSQALLIKPETVERFKPEMQKESKKTTKKRNDAAKTEHTEIMDKKKRG